MKSNLPRVNNSEVKESNPQYYSVGVSIIPLIFYTLLAIASAACLFSCKTPEKLYNKAKAKDEVKVAELARKDFPCTTTKIDSVRTVDTLYDLIEVECPDTNDYAADTGRKVLPPTGKVKPNIKTVYVPREVVTIRTVETIEDSAKIKIMYAEIQKAAAMIVAERKLKDEAKAEAEKERKAKNKWCKWFWILFAINAAIIAFRLFRSKIGL
jgi:phosphate/sulfate permease